MSENFDSDEGSNNRPVEPEGEARRHSFLPRFWNDYRGSVSLGTLGTIALAGLTIATPAWNGVEIIAKAFDYYEKIENGLHRLGVQSNTAQDSAPKTEVAEIPPSVHAPSPAPVSPADCTNASSLSELFQSLGDAPTITKQAKFNSQFRDKQVCEPGWPGIVDSILPAHAGKPPLAIISDPGNKKYKLQIAAGQEIHFFKDGASVYVTITKLTELSDREYIVGELGALSERKAVTKSSAKSVKKEPPGPTVSTSGTWSFGKLIEQFQPATPNDEKNAVRDPYTRD